MACYENKKPSQNPGKLIILAKFWRELRFLFKQLLLPGSRWQIDKWNDLMSHQCVTVKSINFQVFFTNC